MVYLERILWLLLMGWTFNAFIPGKMARIAFEREDSCPVSTSCLRVDLSPERTMSIFWKDIGS